MSSFTFAPRASYPSIVFDSASMWVAESSGQIYVAYDGDLLRLPLEASDQAHGSPTLSEPEPDSSEPSTGTTPTDRARD